MMATDRIDAPLRFTVKKEENICNNSESDTSVDDINSLLSLSLPLLSMDNTVIRDGSLSFNSESTHLTEMVCLFFVHFVLCTHCIFFTTYTVLFQFGYSFPK